MSLDLNLIKLFLEVYRCNSYTEAGDNLRISQPAVSAAIKRLEKQLDGKLFIKYGRGITPTGLAIKLANRCQTAMNDILNAVTDRNIFYGYLCEPLLHVFPPISNIVLEEAPADQFKIIQAIHNQHIDFAITILTEKDPSLVIQPVFKEPAVVICSQQHPRIQGSLSKEQFYQEQHVIHTMTWSNVGGFEHSALEPIQERKLAFKSSSVAGIMMNVSDSENLGFVAESLAKRWQERLGLQILPSPIALADFNYSLAYHKRYLSSPEHQQLREKIESLFQSFNRRRQPHTS